MPFQCDLCPKSYRYKRNLTRHITEHHSEEREHWNCVVLDCHAKFIRRSYLSKHLIICHRYDSVTARECALNATRGDYRAPTYYDVVSDDDSILDLLAEADGTALDQSFDERIERFNLGQFSPVPQTKGAKCNISDDVSDVSSVTVSADEQDCDLASDVHDGLSGDSDDNMPRDHDNHSDDNMTHDEDNHSDDNMTHDDENHSDDNMAHGHNDNRDDNMAHGHNDNRDDNMAHGHNDNRDDNMAHGHNDNRDDNMAHGDSSDDERDDIIVISSDDEEMCTDIELSNIKLKTEIYVVTVTRNMKFSNGHLICEAVHAEKDYYEHYH